MSQPTTSILLNSATPAAPTGNQNVKPQTDGATPLQSITMYPQKATSSLLGVVVPDGTTIFVDGNGKLSATGGSNFAPIIRGSNSIAANSSSFTVSFPTGTQAGDFAVLFFGGAYNPTTPSGWTQLFLDQASLTTMSAYSKILTSGDISTGSVTLNLSGTFDGSLAIATFIGPTGGVRESDHSNGTAVPHTTNLSTSGSVVNSDVALLFGTSRTATSPPTLAISPGNVLQTPTSGAVGGLLADYALPGGVTTFAFTGTSGAGFGQAIVVVEGVPSGVGTVVSVGLTVPSRQSVSGSPVTGVGTLAVTDNNQNANLVFAGPASGAAAAPSFRALVAADIPGGGGSSVSFGSGAPTGPSVVQSTSAGGTSLAFASNVTSGNLLLVAYKSEGVITGVTISDTRGTSYTLVAQISGQSNNMRVYAGIAPSSGSNTVTIGSAPNNFDRLAVMEVAGASATVDATTNTYSATSPTSLSVTTTNATDFIFAASAGFHNANTFSYGTFTLDSQSNGSDANAIGHLVTSSTGTYTLTVTVTAAAADNQPIILVAFQAAGVAGTEGAIYFDTSASPYNGYVYHSSAWHAFS